MSQAARHFAGKIGNRKAPTITSRRNAMTVCRTGRYAELSGSNPVLHAHNIYLRQSNSRGDRVEPLPNIRDGILVERLIKTMRYVADMRRCQYVLQRAKWVIRRQRLNVEYVDRRAGDLFVLQHAEIL
jgi:hypothetical protein